MKLILQITLGVSFGILLSVGILLGGTMLLFVAGSPSTHLFNDALKQTTEPPLVKLPELPAIPAMPDLPVPAIVQPTLNPAIDTKTAADIQAQQQQQAAHEEKLKQDALFKNWYKKPQECSSPNDYGHANLIKCGNDHIRARAKFDDLYRQGKL
jgi:hypothetical protein